MKLHQTIYKKLYIEREGERGREGERETERDTHKQNAHNDGNGAQPLKRIFETVPRHKGVHWLPKMLYSGTQSVQCHQRTNSEQQQTRFHHKQCASDQKDFTFVKFTTQLLVALMSPLRTKRVCYCSHQYFVTSIAPVL